MARAAKRKRAKKTKRTARRASSRARAPKPARKPVKKPARKVPPNRFANETPDARVARATRVYAKLAAEYPTAKCELDYRSPFELLVATILSAQCTDRRVNMVTPNLFAAYPTPLALANANSADVERIIASTGFFRMKTKNLIAMSRALVDHWNGNVPSRLEDLVTLPGVGRKTGNVVLGNAFNINEGVVVDTHIARLSQRLAFTKVTDPLKIEQDLIGLFPREQWTMLAHLLIWHGRRVCDARKPRCNACVIASLCPSAVLS
ncbi:MAG TPA: endonuclease III [Gemmatimonadaceae bacterium]|nr:endonuclease III [Gemmatimonadaceae bacterium]